MTRDAVSSSSIKSIGHDGDTLEVEFHSGKVYRYAGVSATDAAALIGAKSIGKHFGAHVRGKFDHTLVAGTEAVNADRR
jgi:hypothetical protein